MPPVTPFHHRLDDYSDSFGATVLDTQRWLVTGTPPMTIVNGKLTVTITDVSTQYARAENRVPVPRTTSYSTP